MNTAIRTMLILAALALNGCGHSSSVPSGAKAKSAATHPAAKTPHTSVDLNNEQVDRAGISVEVAGPMRIRQTLLLYGTVAPNAERVRDVAARYPGVIRDVTKRVGDSVRQGETLAIVESNESLQQYAVSSPLAGILTARHANPGEQTGDKSLFTVADLSTVWVELSLFPRDVAAVKVGQTVQIRSADSGLTGTGRITYRAAFGSSSNQTLTARVLLENANRTWAPGLYVTADVVVAEDSVGLAVRNEALQTVRDNTVVFVRTLKGFETRPVRLGRKDHEYSEILQGLRVGENYATRNSFIVAAELGKGEAGQED